VINNPQYLQQYSIQTLERVYKHYYFIIRGGDADEIEETDLDMQI